MIRGPNVERASSNGENVDKMAPGFEGDPDSTHVRLWLLSFTGDRVVKKDLGREMAGRGDRYRCGNIASKHRKGTEAAALWRWSCMGGAMKEGRHWAAYYQSREGERPDLPGPQTW